MSFDCIKFSITDLTFNHISCSSFDNRKLIFLNKLHTLDCRIRSLVELSRKEFHRKNTVILSMWKIFMIKNIYRWFCKNAITCSVKCGIREILHIITNQHPYICNRFDSEVTLHFMSKFLRLNGKFRFFLHIHSFYTVHNFLH